MHRPIPPSKTATFAQIFLGKIRCFVITTTIVSTGDDRYEARLMCMYRIDRHAVTM